MINCELTVVTPFAKLVNIVRSQVFSLLFFSGQCLTGLLCIESSEAESLRNLFRTDMFMSVLISPVKTSAPASYK